MENKYEKIKELLIKYNQEQLLEYDIENNEILLDEILNINFDELNDLYKKAINKEEKKEYNISPIPFIDKDKIPEEEKKEFEKIGTKIIKSKQYGIVTMAGGQGSRLGHNGPKGTYDFGLKTHKTIFEVLIDNLKEAYKKYGVYIPWYIMTSRQNHNDTIEFFERNNYFNYPKEYITFFKQGEYPVLNEEGKVLLDKNRTINKAADGHGGVFASIMNNKIIENMRKRKIKWIFIGPVDNVLVNMVDPIFIGLCEKRKVLAGGKSIVKAYPEEKVGVFCMKDNKPSVIEYTEISKELSEKKNENGELVFAESHINCNLFNIEVIEKLCKEKLPYHSAYKKIEYLDKEGVIIKPNTPNAYKFETFIFDAFEQLGKMEILRVKREEEFAPIKNAEGNDSPETARKLYEKFYNI